MFQVKDSSYKSLKYAGRSRARVIDNRDPKQKGRIRVEHSLLGETGWINYLNEPNNFTMPQVGDVVYVEADAGNPLYLVAHGRINKGPEAVDLPDAFKREAPTNRGIYTPAGHLLEFDDGEPVALTPDPTQNVPDPTKAKQGVRLTTAGGITLNFSDSVTEGGVFLEDSAGNKISVDTLKNVIDLTTSAGASINIDGTTDNITVKAAFGDELSVSASDGIQASTPSGTSLSMKSGEVAVDGTGGQLNLSQGKVALGSSVAEVLQQISDQLAELQTIMTSAATHTHVGNLGYPSAPPSNAGDYTSAAGNFATIKSLIDSIKGSL